jgi:hypothetical protein
MLAGKNVISKSATAIRDFSLTLEPVTGSLTLFYAFINNIMVLADEATAKKTWTGKVPSSQITVKIRVIGIGDATFKLGIDLVGTANDQSLTLKLNGGYYETEITL